MTKERAELLVEAAEAVGVDAEIYECYSGRGEAGRLTLGVVFNDWTDALTAAFEAGRLTAERDLDEDLSNKPPLADSLGRQLILY